MSDETAYVARAHHGYRDIDAPRYERRRYGSWLRRLNLRLTQRALRRALAGVRPGALVLDAPCGTGIHHDFLRARGFRVVGADLSLSMLRVAAARTDALVCTDLETLPFRPGSFDAILCSRFYMHLTAAERTPILQGLRRLTNGPIVATVCHPYTFKSASRAVRRALGMRVKRSPRLTRRQLAADAAASGLRVASVITVLPVLSEVWVAVLKAV